MFPYLTPRIHQMQPAQEFQQATDKSNKGGSCLANSMEISQSKFHQGVSAPNH
ncbi:hypothetical protein REPUB_Repub18cG0065400 [Reevesia pubescens]